MAESRSYNLPGLDLGPPIAPTSEHSVVPVVPLPTEHVLVSSATPGAGLNLPSSRPAVIRRQTPRPVVTRTQSSFVDNPPSPPRQQMFISSGTAVQPHDLETFVNPVPVVKLPEPSREIHYDYEHMAKERDEQRARELALEQPKDTIVEGLDDDHLFSMMRRFDEDVTHTLLLTSLTNLPLSQPDLRRSKLPDVPYSTDVLKANLERLYATGGTAGIRALGEIQRLRSWAPEDRKRTLYFCATYFLAWALGLAIPTLLGFLMVLIVSPESRVVFFPLVFPDRGQMVRALDPDRKGSEGPRKSEQEQKDQAAWEFRSLAESFAIKLAVSSGSKVKDLGKSSLGLGDHSSSSSDDDSDKISIDSDDDFLDANQTINEDEIDPSLYAPGEHPLELIRQNKSARGVSDSNDPDSKLRKKLIPMRGKNGKIMNEKQKKKWEVKLARQKRDATVGKVLKGTQDALGEIADLSEILANALKPPPPYPPAINQARYKLAGAIFLPILLATAFTPSAVWTRGASFAFGFLFFGQPLIDRGINLLIEKFPDWKEYLDLRNSLLYGVPTNDQLVLHLLRVAENHGEPLPRPPPVHTPEDEKEALNDHAPDPDEALMDDDGNPIAVDDLGVKDKAVHKSKRKFLGGLKKMSKRVAGMGADVTVDGVKKKVGTKVDRLIWGDMLKDDDDPESYPCRLNGKNGHLLLSPQSEYGVPTLAFHSAALDSEHEFLRDVNDIVEIKKEGISVPRAVLGWASGADIASQTLLVRMKGVETRVIEQSPGGMAGEHDAGDGGSKKGLNSDEGDCYEFQAVGRREQLFARLLSLGNQRWESL